MALCVCVDGWRKCKFNTPPLAHTCGWAVRKLKSGPEIRRHGCIKLVTSNKMNHDNNGLLESGTRNHTLSNTTQTAFQCDKGCLSRGVGRVSHLEQNVHPLVQPDTFRADLKPGQTQCLGQTWVNTFTRTS